jgi:hypothetical protein
MQKITEAVYVIIAEQKITLGSGEQSCNHRKNWSKDYGNLTCPQYE